ncbi:MAG: DUF1559 domain-containing protein [Isosphaeraceae bacterium]
MPMPELMRTDGGEREGFTLIECLVVVFLIGVLVALLMPAVQSSREAARLAQCQSRLKQFGIALAQHHAVFGKFPGGVRLSTSGSGRPFAAGPGFSAGAAILPFLEQAQVFDSINFTDVKISPGKWVWSTADSPSNSTALQLPLAAFQCPSDARLVLPGSNYRACTGAQPFEVESNLAPGGGGAFAALVPTSAAQIVDGLGMTVGFSERICGSGAGDFAASTGDVRYLSAPDGNLVPDADQYDLICAQGTSASPSFNEAGRCWLASGLEDGLYNHVMAPNSPTLDCTISTNTLLGGMQNAAASARSWHPGGVNILLMDGSVRFVKQSISLQIWRALATRAGGETISSSQY